ncbi:MAG: indole-3-glycerol phosphate synthase TrpC [Acidobacteriota bacterium]|jgi:indole-3-glycerol phosphate synthase
MTWLTELCELKRRSARLRAQGFSEAGMLAEVKSLEPARTFSAALKGDGAPAVIAEIKYASPTHGPFRRTEDVGTLAAGYSRAGAAALSILTDGRHFEGSLENLAPARGSSRIPVLCKDFILTTYQVVEARYHQADAVLLIARILSRSEVAELAACAMELGMEPLIELHGVEDLKKIEGTRPTMVGVNHRNLETLEIDRSLSRAMAPRMPPGAARVAESGLSTAADLKEMAQLGYDAVLVGSALMSSPDPAGALKELLGAFHAPH